MLWVWLTRGRWNILIKVETITSAQFLAFPSYTKASSPILSHSPSISDFYQRQTSSRSAMLCKMYRTTRFFLCNLLCPPQTPSLFPPPSNLLVPITFTILPTSTPRISNVTVFWVPFQSFPHFLEELFRIELIYFHFFIYLSSDMPLDFLFRGFSEVDGHTEIRCHVWWSGEKIMWTKYRQFYHYELRMNDLFNIFNHDIYI